MSSFLTLGVPAPLAAVLAADGKTEPFPIQRDTLPDALAGRDVLGRGRTGSGKTIAFSLPLVARLTGGPRPRAGRPRGLVLAPTRELATQISATIKPLADAAGLTVTTIFGGVSQRPQEQALARGVDIVVACPGRLEDLMKQRLVDLGDVQVTVLDEADHMADLGFLPGVTRILAATPAGGQRMLFSATLDRGVDVLVRRFLQNEVRHEVDESGVPQGEMTHRVFVVPDADEKTALVRHLASGRGRRILFTRTKHQAKRLAKQLTASGIPAVDLHGNLSQNARDRNLAAFGADAEAGGVRVLVATDVAARGVHVDDVELVVHVDPPAEHKAYLHRSGRTARAGAEGVVVTVVLSEQRRDVKDLLRQAKITAELEHVSADGTEVAALVGEPAEHVKPVAVAAGQGQGAGQSRSGSGRGGSGRSGAGRSGGARQSGGSDTARAEGSGRREASAEQRSASGEGGSRRRRRGGPRTDAGQAAGAAGSARGAKASHEGRTKATGEARASQPKQAPNAGVRTASGRPTIGSTVSDIRSAGTSRGRGSRRARG